tara:strand:- start:423 stop:632 length:210 start_codon:yes stop_codon:yes gene_type:complete
MLGDLLDWFENKTAELYNNIDKIFKKDYDYEYEKMSKDELEELGRQNGIELDKRFKKETLIQQLKELDK